MSLSLWDYVRRRSCEAVLAGVQDALDQMERQDQSQLIHAAAKTLRRKLQECGNGGNNSKPESQPLFEKPTPEVRPPASVAPAPTVPAQPPQLDNNIRRPPGRPRKETHG